MDDNNFEPIVIPTSKFKKGCILAKDIFSPSGNPIAFKGNSYTPVLKIRLLSYGIVQITVYNEPHLHLEEANAPRKKEDSNNSTVNSNSDSVNTNIPNTDIFTNKKDEFAKAKSYTDFFIKDLPKDIEMQIHPSFKKDYKKYLSCLEEYKNTLDDIIKYHKTVNLYHLVDFPFEYVSANHGKYNTFELLRLMRKDDDTIFSHSYNTAIISGVIGKIMNLPDPEIKFLIEASLIHDIGKFQIPSEILEKPYPLLKEDFESILRHPKLGYDMIKDQDLNARLKMCVLMHHERCDGSGYPDGLKGNEIPDYVKILSIADQYDSLQSSKIYKKQYHSFEIIEFFENDISKYDVTFLIPFLRYIADSYINSSVLLSDGRIATVIMINDTKLSRPLVSIDDKYLDLSKDYSLGIIDII